MGDNVNQTNVVKPGDTLWGISNQFGVSVTELARLNNVNANTLKVGSVLIIPGTSGVNPSNMFLYTVKKGDNLYNIAKKYNTTVDKIIDINNLSNTNLSIGQVIRIPENYTEGELVLPSFTNYVVKPGDSLYSISKNFGISVSDIISDNSLGSNILRIGQVLKIRDNTGNNTEILECFGDEYIPDNINNSFTTYKVVKGDNLYNIAKKFNTSVNEIVSLNKLKNNNLSIGMELLIPSNGNNTNTLTYTVKPGDSLYSISKAFNTSVESIKNKNNLTSNLLTIGQVLKI